MYNHRCDRVFNEERRRDRPNHTVYKRSIDRVANERDVAAK